MTNQMPPAPAKKNTLRNIMIALVAVLVLCGGGCLATTALFAKGVDDAIKESDKDDNKPGGPDNPMTITPGKAFEVDGFSYAGGWVIKNEYDMVSIEGLKVTNNRKDDDNAFVDIKVWKGTEVLASATCSSDEIAVGTTVTLTCGGTEKLPASYDKITINDTF